MSLITDIILQRALQMVIQAHCTNLTLHKPKFDVLWPCSNVLFMLGKANGSDPSISITLLPSLTPNNCNFKVLLICLASVHVLDYGLAFLITVMAILQLFKMDEHLHIPGQLLCFSYKVKLLLTGLLVLNKDPKNIYTTITSWAIASQKTNNLFSLCMQVVSKNPDQTALGTLMSLIMYGISEQWMPCATDTLVTAVNAHNKVTWVLCTPMTPATMTTTTSSSGSLSSPRR
jgi:hypothetical protein